MSKRYGSSDIDLLDEARIKIHVNETLHKSKKEANEARCWERTESLP
jgi:hypothetical protein